MKINSLGTKYLRVTGKYVTRTRTRFTLFYYGKMNGYVVQVESGFIVSLDKFQDEIQKKN